MKEPKGFVATGQEHLVCKLNRSIYGLKQSFLFGHFIQTKSDPFDVLIGVLLEKTRNSSMRSRKYLPRHGEILQ